MFDNYATPRHAKVRAWIAKRPRLHLHFTPTYASWLTQVERWFGLLSQRCMKHATFRSLTELNLQNTDLTKQHNESSKPSVWVATADSIFENLERS